MNPACATPQQGEALTVCALFDVGWGAAKGEGPSPYFHGNMRAPQAGGGAAKRGRVGKPSFLGAGWDAALRARDGGYTGRRSGCRGTGGKAL